MTELSTVLRGLGDARLTLALAGALALLVALAGALRRAGVPPGATRTLVHVATALAVACVPFVFRSLGGPVALALVFAAVNLWAVRHRRLDALHAARPGSYGTVAMPLALVAWAALWGGPAAPSPVARALPWLVLAVADPLAGAVGRRFGGSRARSWAGSGAFFAGAFLVTFALAWTTGLDVGGVPNTFGAMALVAAVATAAEAVGRRGWDNLTVVLGTMLAVGALERAPQAPCAGPGLLAALPAVGVAAAFALASHRLRALSADGAVAAGLLAWALLVSGTAAHAASGLAFFVLSTLLSKWRARRSATAEAIAEKGDRRDAAQVAANGLVGGLCLASPLAARWLGHGGGCTASPALALYALGWVGAFAAAAADTWATELGTRFGGAPRLVTTLRRVPAGTSGGVSAAGIAGSALGALVVGAAFAAFRWSVGGGAPDVRPSTPALLGLALVAGLAGAFADSLLGATLQRRYRRPDGALTEKPTTDGVPNAPAGGVSWMTNDTVNLLATLVGALVAAGLAQAAGL